MEAYASLTNFFHKYLDRNAVAFHRQNNILGARTFVVQLNYQYLYSA